MSENSPSLVEEAYDPEKDSYTLKSGDKDLVVRFTPEDEIQVAIISRSVLSNDPRVPGSTTAVFSRARDLMQERANRLNKPLTYIFSTGNPNMVNWAKTSGQELFGWENTDALQASSFEGRRVFKPEIPR